MSSEPVSPDPGLNAIEAALGSLAPARSRMDRDRVMFRAGQASASALAPAPAPAWRPSPGRWAWQSAAAGLALVALGEAALLARRPPPTVVERVVVVHEPAVAADPSPTQASAREESATRPAGSLPALGQTAYERLTGQVLRYGLDGLPASPSAAWTASPPSSSASSGRLLLEELRQIHDPGDPS